MTRVALVVPGGEKDMGAMGNVSRPPLGVCYLKAYLSKNGQITARSLIQS